MNNKEETDGEGAEESVESETAEGADGVKESLIWKIVLFTIVFAVLAGVLLLCLDNFLTKRRYRRWSLEEKLMAQLKRNVQMLMWLGYQRADSETLEELEKRAWAVMNYEREGQEIRLQFLKIYEDVFYGKHPVSEEMLLQICQEQEYLMEMLKKWRRLVYIYYRFGRKGLP